MGTQRPVSDEAGEQHVEAAERLADFIRDVRLGVEDGLEPAAATDAAAITLPDGLREAVEALVRRATEESRPDPWGFDEGYAEAAYPFGDLLYRYWWRIEAAGVENVPAHGRALLVANWSGSLLPFDAAMMAVALMKGHPLPRWPRFQVSDWLLSVPLASTFVRRVGGVTAAPQLARRLLRRGELVITHPEAARGGVKPFSERYRLQSFGRGSFVETAIESGAPIVPVAVVGAEEIYPKLGESRTLARLTGAPQLPITPTFPWLGPLGLVPLPSRWRIEFCEPIDLSGLGPEAAADRLTLIDVAQSVRTALQAKVDENLETRGPAYW